MPVNENNGGSVSAIDASSGNYGVAGGRVTQLTVENQENVDSIRVIGQPDHGNLTVNSDNTLSLVMSMDHTFSGAMSMSYEVSYTDGSTQVFNDNVNVQPTTQAEGWGQGEFYMLATDGDNDLVIETGDVHRMVHISGDEGALSVQDIADIEGLNANQITGSWLADNPQYGSTEASALDVNAGMSLWNTITGAGTEPSSHWLLFENGYDYDANIYSDGVEGEDPLHPIHITSYGDGETAVINIRPYAINDSAENVVFSDLKFDDGFSAFDANNLILNNVDITSDNQTALVAHDLSGGSENFTLRNSTILDTYLPSVENGENPLTAGTYLGAIEGLLIEGSLFDHNGWAPDYLSPGGGQAPQMFNHNIYIDWDTTDVTLRDNIIMRGASFGAHVRGGGFIEDNLFLDNNVAVDFLGGDYQNAGPVGNFTLMADNVITSGGYKQSVGAIASGIRSNEGEQSSLVDNIVAHLADPNNPDEQAAKLYGEIGLQNVNTPFYDDTIIHNWLGSVAYGETGVNTDGLNTGVLDATTIQLFTQQLLGDPNAGISDLAEHLRAQADGQLNDVVDADLIIAYFQAGFGLSVEDRITPETIRFAPDALGDGIRWDNRLNWQTDDLPGTIAGDSVDLAGNWVNYGGTTTLENLDFGEGGTLNVSHGRLDITDHTAVGEDGGQLNISGAGQVWVGGYTDLDFLDINVDGGRFANTDLFVGNADIDITDGQAILATDGADFILRSGSELNIIGDEARVGFDGDEGGTGVLLLTEGSELRFTAENGQLGTIEEFRSGAEGETPNIQTGVNLGDGTLVLDLSGLGNGSVSTELIRVDEVIGEFGEATVTGLSGNRDTEIVIDYEADTVTLNVTAAGSGSGQNTVSTTGDETDAQDNGDLWAALTSGAGGQGALIGTADDDYIQGGAGSDVIYGRDGNDRVFSGSGNDYVYGGDGNDYVRVGGGVESFDGGSGTDYISYYDSTNGITANLAENTVSGSWAVNDTINSFESISGSRTGDDIIYGTSGANTIRTYGGDDRVYAGGGSDTVELGSGNDYVRVGGGAESFDGGSGSDYISYYDSSNGITIDLAANTVSGSWAVNDTVIDFESASGSGTGDDKMYGTSGANTLKGFGGDDKLYGRSGDDRLYGGSGNDRFDGGDGTDRLWGGSGEDVFHLDFGEGHDIIEDFENNVDEIQLDNWMFASGTDAFDFADQVGTDVVFDFGNGDGLTVLNTTIGQLAKDLVLG
jgi:hypothetical protein